MSGSSLVPLRINIRQSYASTGKEADFSAENMSRLGQAQIVQDRIGHRPCQDCTQLGSDENVKPGQKIFDGLDGG